MTPKTRLLAYIYIVLCGGCLAAGIVLCVGILVTREPSSDRALEVIGSAFVALSVVYFVPGLLGGLGLLRGRPWARTVIIVLSLLGIFAIPIGTALGGFGLWVLLGPDSKRPPDRQAAEPPRETAVRAPAFSPADRKRHAGLLVAAAGVAAAFVVMIGTGYRVTGTSGSPISDPAWFTSIGVLVLVAVVAIAKIWPNVVPGSRSSGRGENRAEQRRFTEERRRDEEERRLRLDALAADPVRRKYVERMQRGESWSDEQIEYDLNADRLATCEHLEPIEHELRAVGIEVRLKVASRIGARCRVDAESLRTRFLLPSFVEYAEPQPTGIAFEDPLPALIACAEHTSVIDVVHPLDATPETPVFPSRAGPRNLDTSQPADRPTDRFTQLRSRILTLARLIDMPAYTLPTYQRSVGTGLPHIEIDDERYYYVHEERGQEFERFATTSLDDLLYRIFRDVAFSMAVHPARPLRKPGEDFRREMFRQQLALLARLNPEWVSRCAAEHQMVLAEHPFVDEA